MATVCLSNNRIAHTNFWWNNNNHRFTAFIQVNLRYLAPPVENWRILLVQSFTARMPLLTATSAFGLHCNYEEAVEKTLGEDAVVLLNSVICTVSVPWWKQAKKHHSS